MMFRMRKDLGKRVPVKRPQAEQDADDAAQWLRLSPDERVDVVGFMTRQLHFLRHGSDLPPMDKTVGRRISRDDARAQHP